MQGTRLFQISPWRAAGFLPVSAAALLAGMGAPRAFSADEPALRVTAPGQSVALSAQELGALPHVEITAFDPHEKKAHRYSGVAVRDILAKVGVPFGEKLRGAGLRQAVIVHSKDGYSTLFAVAEFDGDFDSRTILLVDGEDGKPLPPGLGPLHLVAPGDKRSARWARMVTSIEVVTVPAAGQAAR